MAISNEGNDFTLPGLSLFSPITYKDAKENEEMVKLLFVCTVVANPHFSVNFQKIIYIFFWSFPFYATAPDKLKYWVTLKYI